ncbi:MAG: hypothetical protein ACHQ49_06965 [Elusimicrobiota bacterium]
MPGNRAEKNGLTRKPRLLALLLSACVLFSNSPLAAAQVVAPIAALGTRGLNAAASAPVFAPAVPHLDSLPAALAAPLSASAPAAPLSAPADAPVPAATSAAAAPEPASSVAAEPAKTDANPEQQAAQASEAFDQASPAPAIITPTKRHAKLFAQVAQNLEVTSYLTKFGAPASAAEELKKVLFKAASQDANWAARVLNAQRSALLLLHPLTREADKNLQNADKAAIVTAALVRALPAAQGHWQAELIWRAFNFESLSPGSIAYGSTNAKPSEQYAYDRWRRRMAFAEKAVGLIHRLNTRALSLRTIGQLRALAADPLFAWLPGPIQLAIFELTGPAAADVLASLSGVETTAEFELHGDIVLNRVATTPDGTAAPFAAEHPNNEKWKNIPWNDVPPRDKLALVQRALRRRRISFWSDRSLPIVKIRDQAQADFQAPTLFEGRMVDRGPVDIPLTQFFQGGIERAGPEHGARALELHYRSAQSAGRALLDGRRLVEGLHIPVAGEHQHVPVPFPQWVKADPEFESLRLADYYRRLNLFLEMTHVLAGVGIGATVRKEVTYFGFLTRSNLAGVFRYLLSTARGRQVATGSEFKMAWIGFWGQDKYDKKNMIGFETRGLSSYISMPLLYGFQERMQKGLLTGDYGLKPRAFKRWLKGRGVNAVTGAMYQKPWIEILHEPQADGIWPGLQKWLEEQDQNQEFKMIFFDWSREPALADRPEVLAAVVKSQAELKTALLAGSRPDMSKLIYETGLYGALGDSLGLVER